MPRSSAPISPPTMTIANGRCESEPIPCESAAGSKPSVATSMVIMIGRSRTPAPSMAASLIEHDDAGLHRNTEQSQKSHARRYAEVGARQQQGHRAAHRSQRNASQNQ